MLKRLGLPLLALAGMLSIASPKPAEAKVHFGVVVGSPPIYPYYQYCSPYDPYCSPYTYPYAYSNPYPYYQPYVYGGWGRDIGVMSTTNFVSTMAASTAAANTTAGVDATTNSGSSTEGAD